MTIQNSEFKTQNQNLKLKSDLKYRSVKFSLNLIKVLQGLPNVRTYWILSDQLLRAGTSIGANIVEAKASSSKRDFIHYIEIALKSGNETLYWLYLYQESGLVDRKLIQPLLDEAKELTMMLGSSILTMKGKKSFKV